MTATNNTSGEILSTLEKWTWTLILVLHFSAGRKNEKQNSGSRGEADHLIKISAGCLLLRQERANFSHCPYKDILWDLFNIHPSYLFSNTQWCMWLECFYISFYKVILYNKEQLSKNHFAINSIFQATYTLLSSGFGLIQQWILLPREFMGNKNTFHGTFSS